MQLVVLCLCFVLWVSAFGLCFGPFLVVFEPAHAIFGFCNCSMFCCALLCVHPSFSIILMGKTELVALLCLSSWCLLAVWLFHTMPRVCLPFIIVVFPDHTHYFGTYRSVECRRFWRVCANAQTRQILRRSYTHCLDLDEKSDQNLYF